MQLNTWSLNKRLIRVNPMGQRTHPKVKQTQKGGKRRGRKRSSRGCACGFRLRRGEGGGDTLRKLTLP